MLLPSSLFMLNLWGFLCFRQEKYSKSNIITTIHTAKKRRSRISCGNIQFRQTPELDEGGDHVGAAREEESAVLVFAEAVRAREEKVGDDRVGSESECRVVGSLLGNGACETRLREMVRPERESARLQDYPESHAHSTEDCGGAAMDLKSLPFLSRPPLTKRGPRIARGLESGLRFFLFIFFNAVLLPIPMLLPSSLVHLIYGDSLCFRQEKYSKAHHNHNPHSEEEEGRGFHVAHHRQKRLSYDEGADHVGAHGEEESGGSGLQGEYFAGD
nr:hypothetical protein Iba_chr12fCG6570 [Ipomoea batatas]